MTVKCCIEENKTKHATTSRTNIPHCYVSKRGPHKAIYRNSFNLTDGGAEIGRGRTPAY